MNGVRATLAIVRREFTVGRAIGTLLCLALGATARFWLSPLIKVTAAVMPRNIATLFLELIIVSSAPYLLCAALAALLVRTRDPIYFIVPLYGRQLARALALVAFAGAIAYPLGGELPLITTLGAIGYPLAGSLIALKPLIILQPTHLSRMLPELTSTVTAVIALSATLRDGLNRVAYVVIALVAGWLIIVIYFVAIPCVVFLGAPLWIANLVTVLATITISFIALRAFGEALARYDPI